MIYAIFEILIMVSVLSLVFYPIRLREFLPKIIGMSIFAEILGQIIMLLNHIDEKNLFYMALNSGLIHSVSMEILALFLIIIGLIIGYKENLENFIHTLIEFTFLYETLNIIFSKTPYNFAAMGISFVVYLIFRALGTTTFFNDNV